MPVNSIGDMAQTFMLRRLTTSMKQQANIAAQELTTGYTANMGRKIGGDLAQFSGMEGTLARLKGYRVATDSVTITANAMQSAFGQIDRITEGIGTAILAAANAENPHMLRTLVGDAAARFESVLATLNTKAGDKTLFAGVASDGPAVANADIILSAVEAAIAGAGAISATDIETAVTDWFNDPAGFEAVGYLGGTASSAVSVSAEDRISVGFTAMDPALRNTLKSLAMFAIVDRGTLVPDEATGVQIARLAGTSLLQNQTDRTFLAANLGLIQARIEQAQTRNEAENAAIQMARSDLLAVDPYEAATRMEAAQTQLETLYSVTARLSRLSLVDFLR